MKEKGEEGDREKEEEGSCVVVQSREREGRGREGRGDSTERVKCEKSDCHCPIDRPPDYLFYYYHADITAIPSPDQSTPSYRSIFRISNS